MRIRVMVALAALAWLPARAHAQVTTELATEGVVTRANARWSADRSAIYTRAEVRDAAGEVHTVWQLGGTVDGIGMITSHGPPPLRAGDRVQLQAHAAHTLAGERRWVVTSWSLAGKANRQDFVQTTTDAGAPLRWASGCALITYDPAGTEDIDGDQEFAIMDAALAMWNEGLAGCSQFTVTSTRPRAIEAGFDYVNLVKFRDDKWCRPPTGDMPEICHGPSSAGITTLTFVDVPESPRYGEILDADIELNGVNFKIAAEGGDDGTPPCESVLANTFTHEVGHLIGLDHTCWTGSGERPLDGNGQPARSCEDANLPAEIVEATMFPYQECGEIEKISLEVDDLAGVCAAYPKTTDPPACRTVSYEVRSGCPASVAPRRGAAPDGGLVAMLALLGVFVRRSRSRRRQ